MSANLPDGRHSDRYHFSGKGRTLDASWIEGGSPDPALESLGDAAAGLAASYEARLLSSLLGDRRFVEWLDGRAAGVPQAQAIPEEVERACDAIEQCRRAICEDNPSHPLCIGCTAGSFICWLLRILS
ncbi:MAG: hypothetical protein R3E12_14180 [Candidatus Eisenbacteria bacterium]